MSDFSFDTDASNLQQLVLEKLDKNDAGSFLLVNINTDDNHKLSHDYVTTSVTTLKLRVK